MTTNTPDLKPDTDAQGKNDGSAMHNAECAVDKAKDAMNTGIESGRQVFEEAKGALGAGVHIAEVKLGSAIGIAREAAENFTSSVSGAAAYAGQKAEDATSSVGGLRHIASDVTELIRRNPVPAMLIGIGLGFLVAQASSRRNS